MEVNERYLKALASFILRDLRCECGCTYEQSLNQPCVCGFTHISEIFEDEFGIEFKDYPDDVNFFWSDCYV